MRSYEHLTSADMPHMSPMEVARRRQAVAIVDEGRLRVHSYQKRMEEMKPRHTDRGQEYFYLLGKQYQLGHLIESLSIVTAPTFTEPQSVVIDDMRIVENVLALPEEKYSLPLGPKCESISVGIADARDMFASFLSPHDVELIPWSRTAMYHIMRSPGDLSEEYVGKIDTELKGVFYEYYYPPQSTVPIRSLVMTPLDLGT